MEIEIFTGNPKYRFVWAWCDMCKTWFIRCPKCGNNCCNAGYGEIDGEECDICSLAYSYQNLAWKTGQMPKWEPEEGKTTNKTYLVL